MPEKEALSEIDHRAGKTSARPHWITVLTSVLSTVIATIALTISLHALKTSQQSMKVGQRAYLTVSEANLVIQREIFERRTNPPTSAVWIRHKSNVANLGNTPARSIQVKIQYKVAPGWKMYGTWNAPHRQNDNEQIIAIGDVAPNARVPLDIGAQFVFEQTESVRHHLSVEDRTPLEKSMIFDHLLVNVSVAYKDVFGETHTYHWCKDNGIPPEHRVFGEPCKPGE